MTNISLTGYACIKCGHTWFPKRGGAPKVCPKCHCRKWQGNTNDKQQDQAQHRPVPVIYKSVVDQVPYSMIDTVINQLQIKKRALTDYPHAGSFAGLIGEMCKAKHTTVEELLNKEDGNTEERTAPREETQNCP